jgi:hypothetical protein
MPLPPSAPFSVRHHALAVDEHREAFATTLWTADLLNPQTGSPHSSRVVEAVEQRWFVGAHTNVGGGCQSDSLAQLPLKWMMQKAVAHGLAFRRDVELDHPATPPPISDSYSEFMDGFYKAATFGQRFLSHRRSRPHSGFGNRIADQHQRDDRFLCVRSLARRQVPPEQPVGMV